MEGAIEYLRRKGLATAAKKAGRIATDGLVASYIHAGGKMGVLVEINCETDFVAKTEDFQTFVKNIAIKLQPLIHNTSEERTSLRTFWKKREGFTGAKPWRLENRKR